MVIIRLGRLNLDYEWYNADENYNDVVNDDDIDDDNDNYVVYLHFENMNNEKK